MWHDLFNALALVLVIEGMLPFISPGGIRRTWQMMAQMDDRALRTAGLMSMILGVMLLYLLK